MVRSCWYALELELLQGVGTLEYQFYSQICLESSTKLG